MSRFPIFLLLLILLFTSGSVLAQTVTHDSLTNWVHQGGAPGWTDDVTLAGADFGKVDQLNSAAVLSYSPKTPPLFGPGTYVVSCRVQKFKGAVGAAPLTMAVICGARQTSAVLPISQQTSDKFVYTPAVSFTVDKPNTPVIMFLRNTDTKVIKQNYYFDSFRIGKVDLGKVHQYMSIDRHFVGAWINNTSYYTRKKAESQAAFGEVLHLNSVWWLDNKNHTYDAKTQTVTWDRAFVLDPGTYSVSCRIRKNTSTMGAYVFDTLAHVFDPTATTPYTLLAKGTIDLADQVVGKFVNSPGLTFKITKPQTKVRFIFRNIASVLKSDYDFDSVSVQKGSFETYGTAGKTSQGELLMRGLVPQLGQPFNITLRNVPTAAIVFFGYQQQNIDLTGAGMPGNTLLTDLIILSAALPATNNVVNYNLAFPNVSTLLGATFYAQALAPDAAANAFGVVFSNGCKAVVEN